MGPVLGRAMAAAASRTGVRNAPVKGDLFITTFLHPLLSRLFTLTFLHSFCTFLLPLKFVTTFLPEGCNKRDNQVQQGRNTKVSLYKSSSRRLSHETTKTVGHLIVVQR